MTIGERLKIVRESLSDGKTVSMAKFADQLKVSPATINQWEKGKREIPQPMITLICQEFEINKEWLLTGEGEMKAPLTREAEVAELASKLYGSDPESFKYKMAMYLKDLSVEDWQFIERLIRDMVEKVL